MDAKRRLVVGGADAPNWPCCARLRRDVEPALKRPPTLAYPAVGSQHRTALPVETAAGRGADGEGVGRKGYEVAMPALAARAACSFW